MRTVNEMHKICKWLTISNAASHIQIQISSISVEFQNNIAWKKKYSEEQINL